MTLNSNSIKNENKFIAITEQAIKQIMFDDKMLTLEEWRDLTKSCSILVKAEISEPMIHNYAMSLLTALQQGEFFKRDIKRLLLPYLVIDDIKNNTVQLSRLLLGRKLYPELKNKIDNLLYKIKYHDNEENKLLADFNIELNKEKKMTYYDKFKLMCEYIANMADTKTTDELCRELGVRKDKLSLMLTFGKTGILNKLLHKDYIKSKVLAWSSNNVFWVIMNRPALAEKEVNDSSNHVGLELLSITEDEVGGIIGSLRKGNSPELIELTNERIDIFLNYVVSESPLLNLPNLNYFLVTRNYKLLLIRVNENNSLIEIYEVNLEIKKDLYKYYPIIEQDLHSNSYLINDHVLTITPNGWSSSSHIIKITYASENGFLKNLSEEWNSDKEIGLIGDKVENLYGYTILVVIDKTNIIYHFNKNDICYKKEISYALFCKDFSDKNPTSSWLANIPLNNKLNIIIPAPFSMIGNINAIIENGVVLIPVGSEVFTVDSFIMNYSHLIVENGKNNFLYEKAVDLFKRQVGVIKDTHNAYLAINRGNVNRPVDSSNNIPYKFNHCSGSDSGW